MPISSDKTLLQALYLRAASDSAFRKSLRRVVTAEASYEAYVERKRNKGEQWLNQEDWEAHVFGKQQLPGPPQERVKTPSVPEPKQLQKLRDIGLKRQHEKKLKKLWEPAQKDEARPKRLFSSKEIKDLPKWAAQEHPERDRLFAQAEEALPLMVEWLNQGKGIDKEIGAHTVRRDKDRNAPIDLDQPGPLMVIAPLKTEASAEDKVRKRYGGDWKEGAVDLVRATIAVDKYEDLQNVVKTLKKSGLDLACKPRNRFREATSSGYRDVILNARLPNGHVMELQLHLKPVLKAKEENHELYSQIRDIAKESANEEELTPEARRRLEENTIRMRENYDRAWNEAVKRSDPKAIFKDPGFPSKKVKRDPALSKKAGTETLFFEVDGLPVRWEPTKFPQIDNGEKLLPIKDLEWFVERAVPLSEEDFRHLITARKNDKG